MERGSVVSLSYIFTNPPEDIKEEKKKHSGQPAAGHSGQLSLPVQGDYRCDHSHHFIHE